MLIRTQAMWPQASAIGSAPSGATGAILVKGLRRFFFFNMIPKHFAKLLTDTLLN